MTLATGFSNFTILHVLISLAGIGSGLVVVAGLVADRRLGRWTAAFLATTVLTSVTGFGFPIRGFTPGIALGVVSLAVLAVAIYARYPGGLAGIWRPGYVVAATTALYLNVLVLIVQSFGKVPALKALAPTQSEPPFLIAQVAALVGFLALGAAAVRRFRGEAAPAAVATS